MNNNAGKFVIIILSLLFLCNISRGQNFKKEILIDIPGDNYDVDVTSNFLFYGHLSCYITWINKTDSTYTIYLKQLSPVLGENLIVASDNTIKTNPQVDFVNYGPEIKIAWQTYADNIWKIEAADYYNDTLSTSTTLINSLTSDPQISLGNKSLCWIDNWKLYWKGFDSASEVIVIIDSSYCSNPDISGFNTEIFYEKTIDGKQNIFLADYHQYPTSHWEMKKISDGDNDFNPKSGYEGGIVYESLQSNLWQLVYTLNEGHTLGNIKSEYYNYRNPVFFTYPIPTSSSTNETPFFVAFDSDSLTDNKEIMIKTIFSLNDTLINISDAEGNDSRPALAMAYENDTVFVSIIWEHRFNNKTDLWIAKDKFNPIIGDVETENKLPEQFSLSQNYPNPFNPSTTIEYTIHTPTSGVPSREGNQRGVFVTLKVYDILGREVATLVNEYQQPGKYNIEFNVETRHSAGGGASLPSGIYFYVLRVGDSSSPDKSGSLELHTRKMVLIK